MRRKVAFLLTIESRQWLLTQTQLDESSSLFPSLDLLAECRQVLDWLQGDGKRRKTAGGMLALLMGWFNRAVNRGCNCGPSENRQSQDHTILDGQHGTYLDFTPPPEPAEPAHPRNCDNHTPDPVMAPEVPADLLIKGA